MLNNFSDQEAIEIAVAIRDRLELDNERPLPERWAEKDAMAQVINLAIIAANEKKKKEVAI